MKHRNKLCSQMASMLLAIGLSSSVFASDENYEQCILSALSEAESQQNIEWLKEQCASLEADVEEKTKESKANADFPERSPEQKISRLKMEYTTEDNPFVITPYRLNYILPVTHMTNVNTQPYGDDRFGGKADDLSDEEIKLQLSLKIPVVDDGVFNQEDKIYFGLRSNHFGRRIRPTFRRRSERQTIVLNCFMKRL
ncbi:Phospholipase A1 (modular protein) [Vibrio chagasii]|nr:Phospholipase A1 (modular protein) [Vibrio chagasii]